MTDTAERTYDAIVVRDEGLQIVAAPKFAAMSLESLVWNSDRGIDVNRNEITIAGAVTYRIVGWEPIEGVLQLERVD